MAVIATATPWFLVVPWQVGHGLQDPEILTMVNHLGSQSLRLRMIKIAVERWIIFFVYNDWVCAPASLGTVFYWFLSHRGHFSFSECVTQVVLPLLLIYRATQNFYIPASRQLKRIESNLRRELHQNCNSSMKK